MTTGTARTAAHLDELRAMLPRLRAALIPGTARRWHQRILGDAERAAMDARALAEREAARLNAAAGITALGQGRAPLRLDVLDAETVIVTGVTGLEATVCGALGLTVLQGADPTARVTRIIGLLDRITEDEQLHDHVHTEARHLRQAAARAVGDIEPVQHLKGRCPVCDCLSLRAFPERELVVCVNPGCHCTAEPCPCSWARPRRHRWTYDQWPWLAQLLADELGAAS